MRCDEISQNLSLKRRKQGKIALYSGLEGGLLCILYKKETKDLWKILKEND